MKIKYILKILLVLIAGFIFLPTSTINAQDSRPIPVNCEFIAEINRIKQAEPNPLKRYRFDITIQEFGNEKDACNFKVGETIDAWWYPPSSLLPSGFPYKENQPEVNENEVARVGSVVKGIIDSYDHTITMLELVSTGAEEKKLPQESTTNNSVLSIGIILVVLLGVLMLAVLYRKK